MKKIILFFALLLSITVKSQTWCAPGATWYYGYTIWQVTGFYKISYTGDTIINSNSCKILSKTKVQHNLSTGIQDTTYLNDEYTYADANKVYVYRLGNFYTLYDFSANVGDTITVAGYPIHSGCDSIGKVKVDSVGTLTINSENLRYISVSPVGVSAWGWHSRIVEKIGPVNYPPYYTYLFPQTLDYCGFMLDENGEEGSFRCYSDSIFGSYTTTSVGCDFTVSIDEKNKSNELNIFPNPSTDFINVLYKSNSKVEHFEIMDISGKIILSEKISTNNFSITTKSLKQGIYLLKIADENKNISIKRFSVIPL